MYNFLCQNVLVYYSQKELKTFWLRDISNTREVRKYCFKHFAVYILVHLYQNQKSKKFELFRKIFKPYQVIRYSHSFQVTIYSEIVCIKSITH